MKTAVRYNVIVPIRNIGKLVECVGPSQYSLDSFLLEDTKYLIGTFDTD